MTSGITGLPIGLLVSFKHFAEYARGYDGSGNFQSRGINPTVRYGIITHLPKSSGGFYRLLLMTGKPEKIIAANLIRSCRAVEFLGKIWYRGVIGWDVYQGGESIPSAEEFLKTARSKEMLDSARHFLSLSLAFHEGNYSSVETTYGKT